MFYSSFSRDLVPIRTTQAQKYAHKVFFFFLIVLRKKKIKGKKGSDY